MSKQTPSVMDPFFPLPLSFKTPGPISEEAIAGLRSPKLCLRKIRYMVLSALIERVELRYLLALDPFISQMVSSRLRCGFRFGFPLI